LKKGGGSAGKKRKRVIFYLCLEAGHGVFQPRGESILARFPWPGKGEKEKKSMLKS